MFLMNLPLADSLDQKVIEIKDISMLIDFKGILLSYYLIHCMKSIPFIIKIKVITFF